MAYREHSMACYKSQVFFFVSNIKDKCLKDKVMVSYDVESLFTNIPVKFTTQLILDALYGANDVLVHGISYAQFRTVFYKRLNTWQNCQFFKSLQTVAD